MKGLVVTAALLAGCTFSAGPAPGADGGPRVIGDAAIGDAPEPPEGFDVVSLSFRDSADYAGTRDNWLIEEIDSSRGDRDSFNWDQEHTEGVFGDNKGEAIGLLSFEVFGDAADRVPPGSKIARAVLVLVIIDGAGEPTSMFEVTVPWDEQTTWATFGAEPGPQAGDDYDSNTAIPFETQNNGAVAIDVSASVSRWSDGATNHGWVFRAGSDNGTDVRSREFDQEGQRPALLVDYLVPSSR